MCQTLEQLPTYMYNICIAIDVTAGYAGYAVQSKLIRKNNGNQILVTGLVPTSPTVESVRIVEQSHACVTGRNVSEFLCRDNTKTR